MVNTDPVFTAVIVNYNTHEFLSLTLKALYFLSRHPHKILICDNGSRPEDFHRLRFQASLYPNATLVARTQSQAGSMGHGEALNLLMGMVDTPYTAVLDADCIPLIRDWDQILLDQLAGNVKIAGTPIAKHSPKNSKPTDFPLMFLCLFETATFKKLEIDFRPKNIQAAQDTGWELREKYLSAGFQGKNLRGENTRTYRDGPLAESICDEYYADESHGEIFCSHLGRGSNPTSGKYSQIAFFAKRSYQADKRKWLAACGRIVDAQIESLSKTTGRRITYVTCDQCGADDADPVLETVDYKYAQPGRWKVVRCRRCGLLYTNPRHNSTTPNPIHSLPSGIGEVLPPPSGAAASKLLEIGCGNGARLEAWKALGWDVTGLETDAADFQAGKSKGLAVLNASIEKAELPSSGFDRIILSWDLAGMPSPRLALARIQSWLRPGGELLFEVSDAEGFDFKFFREHAEELRAPRHLYHFSRKSLKSYLKGFDAQFSHRPSAADLKGSLANRLKARDEFWVRTLLALPNKAITVCAWGLARLGMGGRLVVSAKLR